MRGLFLHSLAEFGDLILSCMRLANVTSIAEIGCGEGCFTKRLLEYSQEINGWLYCIDPNVPEHIANLIADWDRGSIDRNKSVVSLQQQRPCDAYILDSDHNYYTVRSELDLIDATCSSIDRPYLAFVHDIGWPCGRRDFYFAPEEMPVEAVHPHKKDPYLAIGELALLTEFGETGARHLWGRLSMASQEGGPANGVLTAVEDFLRIRPCMSLFRIPCLFGLGILCSSDAPYYGVLRDYVLPYHDNHLLRRLEENRIELYLYCMRLVQAMVSRGPSSIRDHLSTE